MTRSVTTIYDNKFRVIALLLLALFASSCKRSSATSNTAAAVPRVSAPISISLAEANAAEPALAVARNGSVYIAWVNHEPERAADVMFARLSEDGHIAGAPVRVNPQAGTATAWRGDPPTLAIAPDNTIFVGWTGRVEPNEGHATNIYLSASRDQGRTFATPVKVNDDAKPSDHGLHSLAIGTNNRVYLAWLDDRNALPMPMKKVKSGKGHHMESNRELYMASSNDGGQTFSTNERVATDVCPCCKTALAVNAEGRLYVSWRQVLPGDFRHVAVSSTVDQGKHFTTPTIVSDDHWVLNGCPVSGPALSLLPDGEVQVLWYSAGQNGQTGLYSAASKDHGASFGQRSLVASGATQGSPVLMSNGSGFVAVWEGKVNNKAQVMSAALKEKMPNEFAVVEGESPVAVSSAERSIIAYVSRDQTSGNIRVVSIGQGEGNAR